MLKYFVVVIVMGTFLMASNYSQTQTKQMPTVTISEDDSDKTFARRRGGKGDKGRRRGGNGLR